MGMRARRGLATRLARRWMDDPSLAAPPWVVSMAGKEGGAPMKVDGVDLLPWLLG